MTPKPDPFELGGADLARWLIATAVVLCGGGAGVLASRTLPIDPVGPVSDVASFEVVFEAAEVLRTQLPPQVMAEPVDEPVAEQAADTEPELEPEHESEPEPEPAFAPEAEPEPKAEPEPEPADFEDRSENVVPREVPVEKPELHPRLVTAPIPMMRPPHLVAPRPPRPITPAPTAPAAPAGAAPSAQAAVSTAPAMPASTSAQEAIWQNRLVAHLDRKKIYPREAQRARLAGTVVMRFTLDAGGRLVSASIAQSSGVPTLDDAAAALVRNAAPYPAPPPGISPGKLTLRVPIAYDMR